MIVCREYAFGSPVYLAALELRRRVLRTPLGLSYDPAELAKEAADVHLGAFIEDEVVATLILSPSGLSAKMRQVAVDPDRQRQGIGRELVRFSEEYAREAGFTLMTLHARQSAIEFYENLGYTPNGEPFTEVKIPHLAMEKRLDLEGS